ncbi:MAG: indole-3-glycerol phosphate synthase TrpC [Bacteroidota bacterium]|nr:indole-3-glycerol phosphate synthase TrpC [Candidatus Kapabacteria bacterium]MDW8219153.1 indole-3-glycerol phosphate synthase TrpC [Bacteroidota bacterium]
MNILETIVAHKRRELHERKELYPVKLLEKSLYFTSPTVSLKKYLLRPDKSGIIAEIKRASPSKGTINKYVSIERTSIGYMQAGASALSILTDAQFFRGSNYDLEAARKYNYCPILRKDFTLDEYHIIEARSIGADAILLIAAILTPHDIKRLAAFAQSLGLEVVLEVHNQQELHNSMCEYIDIVGVNNRDLTTFLVSLNTSETLIHDIPQDCVKISESGINSPQAAHRLKILGYQGFLIGEQFMRHSRPELACKAFIRELRSITATIHSLGYSELPA